jgi:peptidoglycan hydrolase-like protein with peptidoglycan-binding domain
MSKMRALWKELPPPGAAMRPPQSPPPNPQTKDDTGPKKSPAGKDAGKSPTGKDAGAKKGDDKIRALQESLKAAGCDPGPIDGLMGPKTRAAIKKFQQANGLEVDGIAGPKTQAALQRGGGSPAAPPAPASGTPSTGKASPGTSAPGGASTGAASTKTGLKSIAISPRIRSIAVGQRQQFKATARYSDGRTEDVSNKVEWSPSWPEGMSIDKRGLAVAGPSSGLEKMSLTATDLSSGVRDTIDFVVEAGRGAQPPEVRKGAPQRGGAGEPPAPPAPPKAAAGVPRGEDLHSITITPYEPVIAPGERRQYSASGIVANGRSKDITRLVQWSTSDPSLVSIDSNGLAVAQSGSGTVRILAADPVSKITGSAEVLVRA